MTKKTKKKESCDRETQLEQLKRLTESNEKERRYDRALMFAQGLTSLSSTNKKMNGYFLQVLSYIGLGQYEKAILMCNYNMASSSKNVHRQFALLRESAEARKKLFSLRQKRQQQKQKKKSKDFVIYFPLEIIYEVFSWIDFQTFIFCCTKTSIMWNSILTSDYIWTKMMDLYRTTLMPFKVLTDQDQIMLKNELQGRQEDDDDNVNEDHREVQGKRFSIIVRNCQHAYELIELGSCGVHSFAFQKYLSPYGESIHYLEAMNHLIELNTKTLEKVTVWLYDETISLSTLLTTITFTKITRLILHVSTEVQSWSFPPNIPKESFQLPCLVAIVVSNFYMSSLNVVYGKYAIFFHDNEEGYFVSTSEYQDQITYRYIKFFCLHCPRLQSLTVTFPGKKPCNRIMESTLVNDVTMPPSLHALIF